MQRGGFLSGAVLTAVIAFFMLFTGNGNFYGILWMVEIICVLKFYQICVSISRMQNTEKEKQIHFFSTMLLMILLFFWIVLEIRKEGLFWLHLIYYLYLLYFTVLFVIIKRDAVV